jgi:hypothetical protein
LLWTNRQLPAYYAPTAAPAVPFAITSGGTTAMAKGGRLPERDHCALLLARSLSFATPVAVQANSYVASNSLSSLSNSTSTRRHSTKHDAPPPNAFSSQKKMRKAKTDGVLDANDEKDDKDADYIPVTNAAVNRVMEGNGTTWEDNPLTKQHCKAFYLRAFPPVNPHQRFAKPQSKSASIAQCRPKSDMDYIKMVVWNWNKGKEIHTMEDGEEKDDLLRFLRMHKLGKKCSHQYVVEEIWAPGEYQPRLVLNG